MSKKAPSKRAIQSKKYREKRTEEQKQKDKDRAKHWWQKNKYRYKGRDKAHPRNRKAEMKRYHQKLLARVEKGKCRRSANCNDPLIGKTQYCLSHWLALLKNNNHGNLKTNKELDLVKIWKQQEGKCWYTGIPLIPGETSSIEHLIPISRGGTNDENNIKFVHLTINCMKRDMTEEEFKNHLKELLPPLRDYMNKEN